MTRLRPILMTAISAIMALLPSSLSGANAPLARAVIGGLLTSTFLSLVFLPGALRAGQEQAGGQRSRRGFVWLPEFAQNALRVPPVDPWLVCSVQEVNRRELHEYR